MRCHCLLGLAQASPRLIARSPSRLPQLGRRVTFGLCTPRRDKTLVQQTRGRLRRQLSGGRRATLDERVSFGLEIVHVSLDAGDAAHPVAVVFTVVGRLVPNLKRRLRAFYGRIDLETESGDGEDPTTTPIPEDGGGISGLGFRFRETPA